MRVEASNTTRLTIDLPSEMHRLIKAQASLNDLSIKDFIIGAIGEKFGEVKIPKKDKVSKNQMNAKTIATIRNSIKNHDKLKTFNNSGDAMKWLISEDRPKKMNKDGKKLSPKRGVKFA